MAGFPEYNKKIRNDNKNMIHYQHMLIMFHTIEARTKTISPTIDMIDPIDSNSADVGISSGKPSIMIG